MKNITTKIFTTLLLSSLSMASLACELDNNAKMPQGYDFDYYCEFEDGLSLVYKDNDNLEKVRFGYINKQGKLVIPAVYNEADPFSDGLAMVTKNDKTLFIKTDGTIAFDASDADEVHGFSEGYAIFQKDDKWGYYAPTGKYAIEPQYDDAYGFSEGLAAVQKGEKWGFINKNNKTVIPFEYEETAKWVFKDGLIPVKKNGKYGAIDKTNKTVVPFIYDYIEHFEDDMAIVGKITGQDEDGIDIYKYGFVDKQGKVAIPLKYDDVDVFEDGKAEVAIGDDYFYINKQGKKVD